MVAFDKDKVSIRQARAEDAKVVAPLIFSAGPEHFTYWLNQKPTKCIKLIEKAFRANAGILGYGIHWVACVDDEVLGVGAFCTGRQHVMLGLKTGIWFLANLPLTQKLGNSHRGLKLAPMINPLPKNILYVSNLGVSSKAQGKGIGSKLIRFHQLRAKNLPKVKTFGLDVAATNPNAQRLYERLGMSQIWEKQFYDSSIGIPDSRRLTMAVSDIV